MRPNNHKSLSLILSLDKQIPSKLRTVLAKYFFCFLVKLKSLFLFVVYNENICGKNEKYLRSLSEWRWRWWSSIHKFHQLVIDQECSSWFLGCVRVVDKKRHSICPRVVASLKGERILIRKSPAGCWADDLSLPLCVPLFHKGWINRKSRKVMR